MDTQNTLFTNKQISMLMELYFQGVLSLPELSWKIIGMVNEENVSDLLLLPNEIYAYILMHSKEWNIDFRTFTMSSYIHPLKLTELNLTNQIRLIHEQDNRRIN